MDLIPPPNGAGLFYDICAYIFDNEKEDILVGKTDIDSMLYEGGLGADTEMGGFTPEKVPEVSLAP